MTFTEQDIIGLFDDVRFGPDVATALTFVANNCGIRCVIHAVERVADKLRKDLSLSGNHPVALKNSDLIGVFDPPAVSNSSSSCPVPLTAGSAPSLTEWYGSPNRRITRTQALCGNRCADVGKDIPAIQLFRVPSVLVAEVACI